MNFFILKFILGLQPPLNNFIHLTNMYTTKNDYENALKVWDEMKLTYGNCYYAKGINLCSKLSDFDKGYQLIYDIIGN